MPAKGTNTKKSSVVVAGEKVRKHERRWIDKAASSRPPVGVVILHLGLVASFLQVFLVSNHKSSPRQKEADNAIYSLSLSLI